MKLVHLGNDTWVSPDHVQVVKGFDPDEQDDTHMTYVYTLGSDVPLILEGVAADIVAALEGEA